MIDKHILEEIIKDFKNKKTVFLIGAGISVPPPSYIRALPQEDCMKAISNIGSSKINQIIHAIRPEVFFQVLYNILRERALKPLQIINPKFLNSENLLVFPNYIHYFLAERIVKGHVVVTTNLDNLIEKAYEKITKGKKLNVIIYEEDFNANYMKLNKLKSGILIKFHGSFYDGEGNDSSETIRLILQQVQIEFPEFKRRTLIKLIKNFNFIIMGYSGRDDYDIFSFLLNPPSNRKIWWIKHIKESNPLNWKIIPNDKLFKKNKILETLPSLKRTPEDWEYLNASSIVLAYSNGNLIKAHTTNFLTYLTLFDIPKLEKGDPSRVNEKIQLWIKNWSDGINLAEKNEILANLFEIVAGPNLNDAKKYFEKANQLNYRLFEAKNLLNYGRIGYKQGDYKNAETKLKKALTIFEELDSISNQANTLQQLIQIYNRLKTIELGRQYGERAIDLYLQQEKYFEVAQVLRLLALITTTGIPDIYMIDDSIEKNRSIELLEESENFCNISLEILRKLGNRTGERGENQSLNVLGLIYLKLGNFIEAKKIFEKFLDLSGRSRFTRESFQGNRNLALALYKLIIKNKENKKKYYQKCLECYNHSLSCLGLNPANSNFKPLNIEQFITYYNRNNLLLESNDERQINEVIDEIIILQDIVPNLFSEEHAWHWNANLLTQLFRVKLYFDNIDEIKEIIENLIHLYEQQEDRNIKRQPYGIQNAKENLLYIIKRIKKIDKDLDMVYLHSKLKALLERFNGLKMNIPSIPRRDWSNIFNKLTSIPS